jgi:signal transduction histidine kinase
MDIATDLIRAEQHVEIGNLLQRYAHQIVDRWCHVARDETTAAQRVHQLVLRDELPAFIEAMGVALKEPGTPEKAPRKLAREHGGQRWDSGWSLTELVRDYQLLRLVILEFLEENLHRPLYYREGMAVGLFIDDAIAASISRFVAHRDEAVKRMESDRAASLEELSRRKDEFLAILGHELRNPLAPIRNSLMILRKVCAPTNPAVATSLDVLDRQSQQLGRLVDDLLDIARIGRGEFELRRARIDLRGPVEHALQMTESLIRTRQHTLRSEVTDTPLYIDADAHRIAQVAANLLTNAAKYTEPGGNIWLNVHAKDGHAQLCVRDDGIGISPDMLPRVFELFARAEQPQSSGREGLGIGLALVQRLVEQHGGSITAHSPGLGCGTEFIVHLPLASADDVLVIKQVPVEKA